MNRMFIGGASLATVIVVLAAGAGLFTTTRMIDSAGGPDGFAELTGLATPADAKTPQSAYNRVVLEDGPSAYWTLNETAGSTTRDSLGSDVLVTSGGGVEPRQAGALVYDDDGAMAFDGASGVLRSALPVSVGATFSIEVWVKAASSSSSGTLVSLYSGGESRTLYLDGRHFVGMTELSADWPAYSVQSADLNPNVWHHVVFAVDDASVLRLYVDGAAVASSTIRGRSSFAANAVIGWSDAQWMAHFEGTLDEIALYPTALPADRVKAHYLAAGPPCGGSLQTLINNAPPGSVVTVPPCVYRETVTIDKPLTLAGQPGAEIRGSDLWTTWTASGTTWVSQQSLPPLPSFGNRDGRCGERTNRCLLPEQVFMDGKALYPVGTAGRPGPGQFAMDAARHLVLADDPVGHSVEVTTRRSWIVTRSHDVTIHGLHMRHAANDALHGAVSNDGYSNWTIEDSIVSDAHGAVISIHDGANLRVIRNDISRGGNMGVHGDQLETGLIQANRVHDNNLDQFNPTWGAGGVKVTRAQHLVMDSNEVYGNTGAGLWCDVRCKDATYSANRVHDNLTQGISFEISDGARILDNVVWSNGLGSDRTWGGGILVSTSANVDVRRNTLAWNMAGIVVVEQSRDDAIPVRNVQVRENSVVSGVGSFGLAWNTDSRTGVLFEPTSNNTGLGNHYWFAVPEGAQPRFRWQGDLLHLADFMATPGESAGAMYLASADKDELLVTRGIPTSAPPT